MMLCQYTVGTVTLGVIIYYITAVNTQHMQSSDVLLQLGYIW